MAIFTDNTQKDISTLFKTTTDHSDSINQLIQRIELSKFQHQLQNLNAYNQSNIDKDQTSALVLQLKLEINDKMLKVKRDSQDTQEVVNEHDVVLKTYKKNLK